MTDYSKKQNKESLDFLKREFKIKTGREAVEYPYLFQLWVEELVNPILPTIISTKPIFNN